MVQKDNQLKTDEVKKVIEALTKQEHKNSLLYDEIRSLKMDYEKIHVQNEERKKEIIK